MALFQRHTEQQIRKLLEHPTHGVLINGPEGTGKSYVAYYIAAKLLKTPQEQLQNHPYFKVIEPASTSLSIDQIRELQKFLQLTTPGKEEIRRVVIINDAHLMTIEAQNALLKSLEEPPADTVIILTAPITQNLKDTIYSRVQRLSVIPVDKESVLRYFKPDFNEAELNKAYMLSGGYMGLMHALLHDEEHKFAKEIARAKQILSANRYQRLLSVDELTKQKEQLPMFLQACKLICSTALDQVIAKGNKEQSKRWLDTLTVVYEAEAALPHNPNTKLLLTDLLLHL